MFEQRRVQSPLWMHGTAGELRPLTDSLRDVKHAALSPAAGGRILRTSLLDGDTHVRAEDFGASPRDLQLLRQGAGLLFSRIQRVDSELMLAPPPR